MKQSLQLRTSQHLALTPQLQQSIRLLQLSTLELHQELEQILSENPMLERLDDPLDHSVRLLADGTVSRHTDPASDPRDRTSDSPVKDEQPPAGSAESERASQDDERASASDDAPVETGSQDWPLDSSRTGSNSDDDHRPQLEAHSTTLREHLLMQLGEIRPGLRERALVELIIDAINDNGYLDDSLDTLAEHIPGELDVSRDELNNALLTIQSFDPSGVGARNAAECLALQIQRMPRVPFVTRRLTLRIVQEYLPLFAQRDFTRLRKLLDCDDDDLRDAQLLVLQCDPHPGASFGASESDFVSPDVIVRRNKNSWQVSLNEQVMPRLRVNNLYVDALKQNKGDGALSSQVQEARWLIKNMRQRFDTILRVSQAIVERQKNFFSHGEVAMRPLVLREIADTLGLHESTISRVTTQKYMLTPHGMFELKYFFGSHVATEAGGEASSTAIRALIKQLIGAEDSKAPFSDSKIADMLAEQGMVVARRTVAKYREALRIPAVNLRKSL